MISPDSSHAYDDIINLPHPVSAGRKHMTPAERGAQFSPFAALTGFHEAVEETARLTDMRLELDESSKSELNAKIEMILENLDNHPIVTVTHFVEDGRKQGGAYDRKTGTVRRVDGCRKEIIMDDGTEIPFEDIAEISGELFSDRLTDFFQSDDFSEDTV